MFKTLLVEDNEAFRQSLREILQVQFPSIIIEEATEAGTVMEKVRQFIPDLIFMDIRLPGGNGLDLTRRLKEAYPRITVILLTSYDFLEYRQAAAQYGAEGFLSKGSVTRETIVALVKSLWNQAISPKKEGADAL
jgi:DNA-binding NarL/FixJ family response regulator